MGRKARLASAFFLIVLGSVAGLAIVQAWGFAWWLATIPAWLWLGAIWGQVIADEFIWKQHGMWWP